MFFKEVFVFKAGKLKRGERITFTKYSGVAIEHDGTVELSKKDQELPLIAEYIQNGKDNPLIAEKNNPDESRLIKVSKPGKDHQETVDPPKGNEIPNEFNALIKSDASKDDINDWAARNLPKLNIKSSMNKDKMIELIMADIKKMR